MNPAAALLNHCTPREAAKLFGEPGSMNPSSSHVLVRQAVSGRKGSRRSWTREAETGEAVLRLARRGSPRRGRRSLLDVLRDGQFPGRGRQKTLSFGPEAGKATAQLAGRSCPQGAASSWLLSPTPRLTTGCFSKSSSPTNGRSTSFMRISARFPIVASNWEYRAVLRDDVDGKVALFPRQGDDGTGAQGSQARTRVLPQAQTPPTRASGPTAAASSASKIPVNQRMKRARWSMRPECPHHRWSDRLAWRLGPRTKRRMPLDGENPAVKTGSLAKIDPHPACVASPARDFCRNQNGAPTTAMITATINPCDSLIEIPSSSPVAFLNSRAFIRNCFPSE